MTRRDRHRQPPPDPPQPINEASRPVAWRWGQALALLWYVGGFAVLIVGVVTQTGPYAWMARWEVRTLGANSVMGSFLPGFGVLLVPMLVLACLPRRADWPFVAGAKEAFWPERRRSRAIPAAMLRRWMQRASKFLAGFALCSLLAGSAACWFLLRPGAQVPGSPLPRFTVAQVVEPGGELPEYARLVAAELRPDLAWAHDYAIRNTRYHNIYTPLISQSWRPGDPVSVLQLDTRAVADTPGPSEGRLSRGLPAWLVASVRDAGVDVVDDPVVLSRRMLHGVVPAPDEVEAVMAIVFGGVLALILGAMAFSLHWRCRRPSCGSLQARRR